MIRRTELTSQLNTITIEDIFEKSFHCPSEMSRRPNFAQAHRKPTQQSETSKSRPSAASSSLPVLTFSKFGPTNYISWSEEVVTRCIREYGLLASCLQTAEYPEIADDEPGLVKFRYQEQVKARNKKQF